MRVKRSVQTREVKKIEMCNSDAESGANKI